MDKQTVPPKHLVDERVAARALLQELIYHGSPSRRQLLTFLDYLSPFFEGVATPPHVLAEARQKREDLMDPVDPKELSRQEVRTARDLVKILVETTSSPKQVHRVTQLLRPYLENYSLVLLLQAVAEVASRMPNHHPELSECFYETSRSLFSRAQDGAKNVISRLAAQYPETLVIEARDTDTAFATLRRKVAPLDFTI